MLDLKNITKTDNSQNNELKNIIDYKKLKQYILNGKVKQVTNLLDLIRN